VAAPSKSVTHRLLVAGALAHGRSLVRDPLDADDTRATRNGLEALGVRVEDAPGGWVVHGGGGRVPGGGRLDLGESGTSLRFLLAVAALGERPSLLDGAPRLRERPIADLADALTALGARVVPCARPGSLPLEAGGKRPAGGRVGVPGSSSSQFASALLLVGSSLPHGLDLTLEPPAVSLPYVRITERVLSEFGVALANDGLHWRVPPAPHSGREVTVEGDWSSASYLLAAAAIGNGRVVVTGLSDASAQPDARLVAILRGIGCAVESRGDRVEVRGGGSWSGFDLDLGEAPDLVPTVAALAAFATGPSRIRGVGHLRFKESDRLATIAANLAAIGRPATAGADRLDIGAVTGPLHGATIRTASDHRIAMAFAVVGLAVAGVVIDDAGCVAKSHPGFWDQLSKLEG
jgi:3-phosphoshikimate 1-carboxyvinyltransferase